MFYLHFPTVLWTYLTFHTLLTFDTWIAQAIVTKRRSLLPLGIDHCVLPLLLTDIPYHRFVNIVMWVFYPHPKPAESLFHFKARGRTIHWLLFQMPQQFHLRWSLQIFPTHWEYSTLHHFEGTAAIGFRGLRTCVQTMDKELDNNKRHEWLEYAPTLEEVLATLED